METSLRGGKKWIIAWLLIGVVMVFVQIMLGGVTRLTGSGLSITRWDIITGTIPPLNLKDWEEVYNLYKTTPQYQKINNGISLEQFKFIFFWEYIHRLWARAMGFVFIIPFFIFLVRGYLSRETIKKLGIVIFFAALAALFGWIMVVSGLNDRPWVNAYKLTIHLGLGIALFIVLFYTWMSERGISYFALSQQWRQSIKGLIGLTVIQICFGGFVSGMKSALLYPTWPLMNGSWFPSIILDPKHWNVDNFLLYDQSGFMPALVQVIHRNLAYLLAIFIFLFAIKWMQHQIKSLHWIAYGLMGNIVVQILLGILTLLGSKGSIPILFGVLHQGMGIIFLTTLIYLFIRATPNYI